MKIKSLKIERFRHLKKIEMHFGNRVTAIAGQNGTGKSSVLGLVGHVFSFRDEKSLIKHKTIDSKPFETQFSEIFKFSYPKYDKPGEHIYNLVFQNDESVQVTSSDRLEKGRAKALRLNVGKKEKGEGKKTKPVIYLGLRRLFPLAQEKRIKQSGLNDLTENEIQEYQNLHNSILLLNETIKPEFVDTFSKKFYATTTASYDEMGNSAGQDNVGQIITAILSFKRLKENLGEEYGGGVLLIDEIDATLFSAAQEKLIEKLFRASQDLDLQIIFTTHSLEIISKLKEPQYKRDSEIIFLDNTSGSVVNAQSDDLLLSKIINNLKVTYSLLENSDDIYVFCEDAEATLWTKNLLGKKITKNLTFIKDTFGASNLIEIANKKIPIFKTSIFILDGDQQGRALRNNKSPRVINLPGDTRPENIFYSFLKNLPANDSFWGGTGEYTQQVCFKDRPTISTNRTEMKNWFLSQKPHWGQGCTRLFNRWEHANKELADAFVHKFQELMEETRAKN